MASILALLAPYTKAIVAAVVASTWEFWLGKTEKVKAGSTLELIGNFVISVIQKLTVKKPIEEEKK